MKVGTGKTDRPLGFVGGDFLHDLLYGQDLGFRDSFGDFFDGFVGVERADWGFCEILLINARTGSSWKTTISYLAIF